VRRAVRIARSSVPIRGEERTIKIEHNYAPPLDVAPTTHVEDRRVDEAIRSLSFHASSARLTGRADAGAGGCAVYQDTTTFRLCKDCRAACSQCRLAGHAAGFASLYNRFDRSQRRCAGESPGTTGKARQQPLSE